jgi:hypothetical protein
MITNHLLEAKYKVQKQLSEDAKYDIMVYASNSHRIVVETETKYKVKFSYASTPMKNIGQRKDVCE